MTALEQVNRYLHQLETRLRMFAALRGFALTAGVALLLTVVLAFICNRFQFAHSVVLPLRILLYAAVGCAIAFAISIPVSRLTRRRVTRLAEGAVPGFNQRLLTVTERPDLSNPFTELIAEDVLRIARENEQPRGLGSSQAAWTFAGAGALAAAVLIWLIVGGPGFLGYGAALLWTGSTSASHRPIYEVTVQPGNKTIRRKSDQLIDAQLVGFAARQVTLHARYASLGKWQETAMQPGTRGDDFRFLFPAISEPVEYYVQADGAQSKHYTISVKDLPTIKQIRTLVHFPGGLGLKDVIDISGGDIRAVEGSEATVSILTDKPLDHGMLVIDNSQRIELKASGGGWLEAKIPVKKDGVYHVATVDNGETIRLSDDYFIEAKKDEAPVVRLVRPGRDPRVSPIEELPVGVEASDDFGVKSLELHYSVNGGAEQVARFRSGEGKEEKGHTTLYLENFKLAPGDVISMFATAADANQTTRSDILFAQTEAYDYKFSQSQQSGGGGGAGGGQNNNISERQKQIIAATFNELRNNSQTKASIQEQAHLLSDLESKLSAQAQTLAQRMSNRELSPANQDFQNFSKLMMTASSEMGTAVQQLSPAKWHDALEPEQRALQSLLRAEAQFRNIQVAFGQQSGGGGGGGAERELARMFDLELDTSKNQYETGQSAEDAAQNQQKALDDAFERLQILARRQQELAEQRNQQQPAEQRWQEEQLRREAEELRRKMQELAKNSQNGQQSSQSQSGQSQSSQSQSGQSQGSQSGQQSASAQGMSGANQQNREMNDAMRRTTESLSQAESEMRQAVASGDRAAQQRASGQLTEAQRQLESAMHRNAGSSLSDLSQRADSIARQQRDLADRLKQLYGMPAGKGKGNEMSSSSGSEGNEMPEMNDPDNMRFSYGYRRRNLMHDLRPTHRATTEENALASDKDNLAQQLKQLQQGLQEQKQTLGATSPDTARKVQRALSDAEQKELALRMEKNAQWIREGYGDRNLEMEDTVTAGVEQLSRDLRGAQQALGDLEPGGKNGSDPTAKALAEVRQLRQQLEQAQQGRQGEGQQGQSQQGQGRQGQPQGGQASASANGLPQGSQSSAPGGQSGDSPGLARPGNRQFGEHELQQAIGELSALRGQISGQDRALGNYVGGTLGYLRNLNADPGTLQSTIGQDTVASLERLEAELSRKLGEQQSQGARSGASDAAAEKYRAAVAEYFKKLSQPPPSH